MPKAKREIQYISEEGSAFASKNESASVGGFNEYNH